VMLTPQAHGGQAADILMRYQAEHEMILPSVLTDLTDLPPCATICRKMTYRKPR